MSDTLQRLAAIIEERKSADPDSSYVAQLHHKGLEKILAKVAEETDETIEAAREAEQDGKLSSRNETGSGGDWQQRDCERDRTSEDVFLA